MIYKIAVTLLLLALSIFLALYYNNGKGGAMSSWRKVTALVASLLSFACFILSLDVCFGNDIAEALHDGLNSLLWAFLGALVAFLFKNGAFCIRRQRAANEEE